MTFLGGVKQFSTLYVRTCFYPLPSTKTQNLFGRVPLSIYNIIEFLSERGSLKVPTSFLIKNTQILYPVTSFLQNPSAEGGK